MDDDEREALKQEAFIDRKRANNLRANPDCRDPDHPGCADCEDFDEGEDE